MKTHQQKDAYSSPWTVEHRVKMLLWEWCWLVFCVWTPKPCNGWRLMWLKLFGAKIEGAPFVHQRARIQIPWNLTLRDKACLGDRTNAYTLGPIEIRKGATVGQEAYLCTGTHDIESPAFSLQTAPIVVGEDVFIGVRAIILPGIEIGKGAVIGAGSIVTRNVAPGAVVAGNPAKVLRVREIGGETI